MAFTSFCENGKRLDEDVAYNHGLPRCLFETVSSVLLLLVVVFACLPQLVRMAYSRQMKRRRYGNIQDFEQSVESPANDLLFNTDKTNSDSVTFVDDPASFIYGENYRTSFWYTCQLFFHICQILLPLVDLIATGERIFTVCNISFVS